LTFNGIEYKALQRLGLFAPLLLAVMVSSCVTPSQKEEKEETVLPSVEAERLEESVARPNPDIDLEERLSFSLMSAPKKRDKQGDPGPEGLFSFEADEMPLTDVLRMFAQTYELNIVVEPDVASDGNAVSVYFRDLPFSRAMQAILDSYGYSWVMEDGLIRIRKYITRIFHIDYVRLARAGKGSTSVQVSSQSGGGGGEAGMTISNESDIKFWKNLQGQLVDMRSKGGDVVINEQAGIIQVTDLKKNIDLIDEYLQQVSRGILRQVEIEAKIFEVTLQNDFSLGIDWSRITLDGGFGLGTTSNNVTQPFGVAAPPPTTAAMTYSRGDFAAVLSALEQQGTVNIISQPKIKAMNNQPSLIKVGTDQPVFTQTTTTDQGVTNTIESLSYITLGVVLSVTPQISYDGYVMLDVTPIITRQVGSAISVGGSTAPIIDIKQSSTIVRVRDGEMAVISGLIQEDVATTDRKVPLLGDTPGIGALFRGKYKQKTRRELVVFLITRIVEE